jgi:hypothetical protein
MGSALAMGAAAHAEERGGKPHPADLDPRGGFTGGPQKKLLFVDLRHIDPGDLFWRAADGTAIPVAGPPEPPVPVWADASRVVRGVKLVAQKPQKEGPIEKRPGQVVRDGGVYRGWSIKTNYAGADLGSYSSALAESIEVQALESNDGYAWSMREACTVPLKGISGIDGSGFFIDPNGSPDERYKCVFHAGVKEGVQALWEEYQKLHPRYRDNRIDGEHMNCLYGMTSPDGLNWKLLPEPLLIHQGDTDNTVYYDAWLGKYVLYTRLCWLDRRLIGRAESDDFRHWSPVIPMLGPSLEDAYSYDVYLNARTEYPDLPGYHLMFPMFYRRYTQTSEIRMYSSLDGILWDAVPGGPILEPGGWGKWDGEFVTAGKNLVPLGSDKVAIPYNGTSHPHKFPRWSGVIGHNPGWATWPKDRISALTAVEEGEFHTFSVPVTGTELRVNARVARAGSLQIGLTGIDNHSVELCDTITGDETAKTVTWGGKAELGIRPGDQARLHVRMRAAELFAIEWA